MSEPRIYLVVGWSGEYSDFTQWPVTAYSNAADAWMHVERCKAALDVWRQHGWEFSEWEEDSDDRRNLTSLFADLDPKVLEDYVHWDESKGYEMWEIPLGKVGGCRIFDNADKFNLWKETE